jgi:D-alanyl-D-alanine carboxypeptidase
VGTKDEMIGSLCRLAGRGRGFAAATLCTLVIGMSPGAARAQIGSDRYSSIVMNAATGSVIEDYAADEPRHPASLTKMMTLYMLFDALRDRRVSLDEQVPVSTHAASMVPTKLGLVPGTSITVEQAILGLVTLSANDAAAALGEMMGGDEAQFAQMMTLRARGLGMVHTVFRNASGLPDPDQVTTAHDMAILARHLIQDYPAEYHYFSVPSFTFHGRTIFNHDTMLKTYPGADGLKTGYIADAGRNLVTSAVHDGVRLIGVVLGAATNAQRSAEMTALLDRGFETEGVAPVVMARAERASRLHMPALIATAHAGSLPARFRPSLRLAMASRPVEHPVPHAAHPVRHAAHVVRHAAAATLRRVGVRTHVAAHQPRADAAEPACSSRRGTRCAGSERRRMASR